MLLRLHVWNGARLLDRRGPAHWADMIDAERIDLMSARECVLGQLFGSFDQGLDRLDIDSGNAYGYGFAVCTFQRRRAKWLWKQQIAKRRTRIPEVEAA